MAEASSLLVEVGIDSILQESRLNAINVVVGRQGESCDSVCKLRGQSGVPNKLAVLNQCDVMQKKYMTCKGACLASVGTDQPAEVVHDAPKHLRISIRGDCAPVHGVNTCAGGVGIQFLPCVL